MPRTKNIVQPVIASAAPVCLFVSLELSRSRWLVTLLAPGSETMSKHSVPGGDGEALLALLTRQRAKAERHSGQPVRIVTIQEAGLDGFWIHRLLEANGIESHVVEPASIAVARRHRRAKTDAIDGEALLRTLMAYKRGEPRVCSMVVPPRPDEEDRRRLSRERQTLVAERIEHTNRIKGLLAAQDGKIHEGVLTPSWDQRLRAAAPGLPRAARGAAHRRRPPAAAAAQGRDRPRARSPRAAAGPDRRDRDRAHGTARGGHGRDGAGGASADTERNRTRVRHGALAGGLVPGLPQPPAGGGLRGPRTQPVAEWEHERRAGYLEIGQPAAAHNDGLACVVVAASPARHRAEPLVPGARARRARPRPPHRDRGPRSETPRCLVAVRD